MLDISGFLSKVEGNTGVIRDVRSGGGWLLLWLGVHVSSTAMRAILSPTCFGQGVRKPPERLVRPFAG
jgi:hypothetical protein